MKKIFYRVQKDDTLFSLAERLNFIVTKAIRDNNLSKEIEEGDVLYLECEEKLYSVEPTDTLESLSRKYNVSINKIKEDNGVDYLFYGLKIKIE